MKRGASLTGLAFVLCLLWSAETVDRLAITVGTTVITERQIDEDLRVVALLNNQAPSFDAASRRAAADRLVNQLLIDHEMEFSHYPPPSDGEINSYYARVEETLGGPQQLQELLAKSHLLPDTLRMHLRLQLTALRFIETRFRPDVSVSDSDVEAAYRAEQARLRAGNVKATLPSLDDNERAKLSSLLIEEHTDAALNSWLERSRKQANIVYLDSALR